VSSVSFVTVTTSIVATTQGTTIEWVIGKPNGAAISSALCDRA
jgi:hypothetical protein